MAGPIVATGQPASSTALFMTPITRIVLATAAVGDRVNYKSPSLPCLSQIARNLNGNEVRTKRSRLDLRSSSYVDSQ